MLLGSLTHTALHGGASHATHSTSHCHCQPIPQEASCHIADHIQVIMAGFAEQSKASVLHMSSLFHAFILCQVRLHLSSLEKLNLSGPLSDLVQHSAKRIMNSIRWYDICSSKWLSKGILCQTDCNSLKIQSKNGHGIHMLKVNLLWLMHLFDLPGLCLPSPWWRCPFLKWMNVLSELCFPHNGMITRRRNQQLNFSLNHAGGLACLTLQCLMFVRNE
jgi:hypothetical protein